MGNAAVRPSQRVANLLRDRRKELKLTLREVSEQIEQVGERLPISTLGRIEKGQLEPGVRRLQLLLRFYGISAGVIDELTELDVAAQQVPQGQTASQLFESGKAHWESGAMELGLAFAFAAMDRAATSKESERVRQESKLMAAGYARGLGRDLLARYLIDGLLCEPPMEHLRARVLMVAASIWRSLGADDVAVALVKEAKEHVRIGDDQGYAMVFQQTAKICLESGRLTEAAEALEHAFRHARDSNRTNTMIGLGLLRSRLLESQGDLPGALKSARTVIEASRAQGKPVMEISGHLELGQLLAAAGNPDDGIHSLRTGLSLAAEFGDEDSEFLGWFRLWKIYEEKGQSGESEKALARARAICSGLQRTSPEILEIRGLGRAKKPKFLAKQRNNLR